MKSHTLFIFCLTEHKTVVTSTYQPGQSWLASREGHKMHNVSMTLEGKMLVIRFPVDEATLKGAHTSKSGKRRVVASTGGFKSVDGVAGVELSLNATINP